ncbi:MAG: Crp/Fnr family transcriptional regulator [Gammaproteobacteria bacterium]
MPFNSSVSGANRLLTALPRTERERLQAHGEPVELVFAEVLYRAGNPIPYVYFPTGGFISLITQAKADSGLEVGLIGNEGMLGSSLVLGVNSAPFQAVVQGTGSAIRIRTAWFLGELDQNPVLKQALNRYLYVLLRQFAQSVACNRFHLIEARLARRLLMAHDRSYSDTFHATHVSLATILGVRRVGITKAAHSLQQQNLICYRRGDVTILNRAGLEAVACDCYQIEKEAYDRIVV